jgi:hypothetical protein
MTININDRVRVMLTAQGAFQATTKYKQWGYTFAGPFKERDIFEVQLWELMKIFGPDLFNGCIVPFEGNIIEVVEEAS